VEAGEEQESEKGTAELVSLPDLFSSAASTQVIILPRERGL
jgi:hypothetical protein